MCSIYSKKSVLSYEETSTTLTVLPRPGGNNGAIAALASISRPMRVLYWGLEQKDSHLSIHESAPGVALEAGAEGSSLSSHE